jgi:hypothetical protein
MSNWVDELQQAAELFGLLVRALSGAIFRCRPAVGGACVIVSASII